MTPIEQTLLTLFCMYVAYRWGMWRMEHKASRFYHKGWHDGKQYTMRFVVSAFGAHSAEFDHNLKEVRFMNKGGDVLKSTDMWMGDGEKED